jgi:hypothetical protein
MARYGRAQLCDLGQTVAQLPELTPARPALPSPPASRLAEVPRAVLEALAVLGLAALAAGWFGPTLATAVGEEAPPAA